MSAEEPDRGGLLGGRPSPGPERLPRRRPSRPASPAALFCNRKCFLRRPPPRRPAASQDVRPPPPLCARSCPGGPGPPPPRPPSSGGSKAGEGPGAEPAEGAASDFPGHVFFALRAEAAASKSGTRLVRRRALREREGCPVTLCFGVARLLLQPHSGAFQGKQSAAPDV